MVVHDLNHAARYAHHMVPIKKGTVISSGTPAEVMNLDVLRELFGIEVDIILDPRIGVPLCLPYELAPEAYKPGSEAVRNKELATASK